MKTEVFSAWSIDTQSDEGHGLIGRYWWISKYGQVATPNEGCKKALFATRKLAREHLKYIKGTKYDGQYHAFPKAKVVHVRVEISEIK